MEPYQIYLVAASCIPISISIILIFSGLGFLLSKISRCDDRIQQLEVEVAVLKRKWEVKRYRSG